MVVVSSSAQTKVQNRALIGHSKSFSMIQKS